MSGSDFRIDSHKLIFHVDRVSQWLRGKQICPIYCEVGLTSICNQRCIFCGLDYMHGKHEYINTQDLKKFIRSISKMGLKSIMFAGEGEPLLHKDIVSIVGSAKENGLDIAITTNGVLMDEKFCKSVLGDLSWIRISLDAARPSTYSKIHATNSLDFKTVIHNIKQAVALRNRNKYATTIGIQFLLLNQNYKEVYDLARLLKKIGVDYLAIKPYSKHPLSKNDLASELDYSRLMHLEKGLRRFNSKKFSVIFRKETIKRRRKSKGYERCLGLPFWIYVSASCDVYPCSTFLGVKKYVLGNIRTEKFNTIWASKRKKDIMKKLTTKMNPDSCRELCRLDKINTYLWDLVHPGKHRNFI